MLSKPIHWINSSVINEALMRYQEDRLSKPLALWLEQLLEIENNKKIN